MKLALAPYSNQLSPSLVPAIRCAVLVTDAASPMRVVEAVFDVVTPAL